MNMGTLLKIALRSVLKNRLRTFLTMLGIIIGVASVIIMVSIGQGTQKNVESQISAMGTNLLTVFPGSGRFGGIRQSINKLSLDDAVAIGEQCNAVEWTSAEVRSTVQAIAGSNNCNTTVTGVSPAFFNIRSWTLAQGVCFTDRDVATSAKVVILGNTVAEELFGAVSPVGQRIRILNVPFRIIGVLAAKGTSAGPGGDQDDAIYGPVTTVLNRLVGSENGSSKRINTILASAKSPEQMGEAEAQIGALLRKRHNLHGAQSDDFTVMNQTEIINMATQTTSVFTLLLGSIAGVSLIVGGIGIMNIMLVSVTERTREIGIRLAIGARYRDILLQFVIEAVVISMLGGVVGIACGLSISLLLHYAFKMTTIVSPLMVIIAPLFSGMVGVFFGFYPARKAAAQNPIDALHYE